MYKKKKQKRQNPQETNGLILKAETLNLLFHGFPGAWEIKYHSQTMFACCLLFLEAFPHLCLHLLLQFQPMPRKAAPHYSVLIVLTWAFTPLFSFSFDNKHVLSSSQTYLALLWEKVSTNGNLICHQSIKSVCFPPPSLTFSCFRMHSLFWFQNA